MEAVAVFALAIFAGSVLVFGQGSDEGNALLQAERDLALLISTARATPSRGA
jgi:hypothetical protein